MALVGYDDQMSLKLCEGSVKALKALYLGSKGSVKPLKARY